MIIDKKERDGLDCRILDYDYGVSCGSTVLKSLQNRHVPELDLLVREAIQNSSDASLGNGESDAYTVNFNTGKFNAFDFNALLTGVTEILNERFHGEAEFLEIRDTGTSGLDGETRTSEIRKRRGDHGNFSKLIYDTGQEQTKESAGGNWGFGKSVYYLVGAGIVVYYSRIKKEKDYEERLIVTLIENEKGERGSAAVLNSFEGSVGRAWWGVREDEDAKNEGILPLTDSDNLDLIERILDIFGIGRFGNAETGTSIIIPYLDGERLLYDVTPGSGEVNEGMRRYFKDAYASSVSAYLKLAIQKWYAPKIHNRNLTNRNLGRKSKWLRAYVDGDPIRRDDMISFFGLVQELYTTAFAKANGQGEYEYVSSDYPWIETKPVLLIDYLGNNDRKSGCVSFIKVTEDTFKEKELDPYCLIGKFRTGCADNSPIVMYARDPGMVIEYATDGPWFSGDGKVGRILPTGKTDEGENEYLLAFFVPDLREEKTIKNDLTSGEYVGMRLGEYLRKCEVSDHMSWRDPVGMSIVRRIQTNVVKHIVKSQRDIASESERGKVSGLSHRLGAAFMPIIGFGKPRAGGGAERGEASGGGGGSKLGKPAFSYRLSKAGSDVSEIEFTLKPKLGKTEYSLVVMVVSEGGMIDAEAWKNEIGTEFPVRITGCETNAVGVSAVTFPDDPGRTVLTFDQRRDVMEIKGTIRFSCRDRQYGINISVE